MSWINKFFGNKNNYFYYVLYSLESQPAAIVISNSKNTQGVKEKINFLTCDTWYKGKLKDLADTSPAEVTEAFENKIQIYVEI